MSQRSIGQNRPRFASTLATLSLSAAVALASANAVAQQPEQAHSADHSADHSAGHGQQVAATKSAAQRKAAIDSTEALINSHKQWAQARGASNKATALESLIAKTEARRELMADLIRTSPSEALRIAIPEEKQSEMPAAVQAMLEQSIDVEGELEVVIADYEDGSHTQRQTLKTPQGDRFELHISGGHSKALQSGKKVRLNGILLTDKDLNSDGDIALAADDLLTLAADGGADGGSNGGAAGPLPNTTGERKVAVIMVNFQDQPNDKPWTASQAQSLIFDQVNSFYQENSYNQTWLTGDVLGWYTVPLNGAASCPGDYDTAADAAAAASGVNLSNYDHIIYMLPPASACSGNFGTVGGSPSRAWINAGLDFQILTHELGHNFGLRHAHGLDCSGGVLQSACVQSEYGDILDIMGVEQGHLNAFHKERLGWLGYNQSPPITEIVTSGTYTITPTETNDNNPKGLKILRGTDPSTGQNSWYYLEYRQPIGFDSPLFQTGSYKYPENLRNGVVIHKIIEGDGNSSNLLDMNPDSISRAGLDLRDPALEVGQSYTDSEAGITITPISNSTSGITVDISFEGGNGGGSTNNPPVAANDSTSTEHNTAVSVPVLSNDSDPDGDALIISNTSGVNGSAQISGDNIIFTPNTGYSGTETFSYSISDGKGGSDTASVSITVAAASNTNQLPVAANDSVSTAHNTSVTIAVLGNDYDPDGDTLSINGTSGVNGNAQVSGGNIIFTPSTGFSGTETFSYTVSDGRGGSDSATVYVNVAAAPTTNQAPVAVNDNATMTSVTAVTIAVLNNDYDPDGDAISVVTTSGGNKGTLIVNSDGTLTYTPGRRFKNGDSFSYTISDGEKSASATVNVQLQQSGDSGGSGGSGGKGKGNGKKS
ncbi:Ig-like domain-containing protein [Amphritea sp. HPY]|uniref:Ig-like domain-containing protein n=1 Tax=Amphritea sp. HPY TaxID=3421652 RepID=UPI003D7D6F3B